MIKKILTESFIEIVTKTSGLSLEPLPDDGAGGLYGISGLMSLNGRDGGAMFVSSSEKTMRSFCSQMMGVTEAEVLPEEITDAICELVNMTAGNARLRLGSLGHEFTLSTPIALEGADLKITAKKRAGVISILLGDAGQDLIFRIVFIY